VSRGRVPHCVCVRVSLNKQMASESFKDKLKKLTCLRTVGNKDDDNRDCHLFRSQAFVLLHVALFSTWFVLGYYVLIRKTYTWNLFYVNIFAYAPLGVMILSAVSEMMDRQKKRGGMSWRGVWLDRASMMLFWGSAAVVTGITLLTWSYQEGYSYTHEITGFWFSAAGVVLLLLALVFNNRFYPLADGDEYESRSLVDRNDAALKS